MPYESARRLLAISALALLHTISGAAHAATEIAWHQVTTKTSDVKGAFARSGTAALTDGRTAKVALQGAYGEKDVRGRQAITGNSVLKFDDESTINVRYSGSTDLKDYTTRGTGEITGGTGRFSGIRGKLTFEGRMSDSNWKGSYTIPGKR